MASFYFKTGMPIVSDAKNSFRVLPVKVLENSKLRDELFMLDSDLNFAKMGIAGGISFAKVVGVCFAQDDRINSKIFKIKVKGSGNADSGPGWNNLGLFEVLKPEFAYDLFIRRNLDCAEAIVDTLRSDKDLVGIPSDFMESGGEEPIVLQADPTVKSIGLRK
ncbi:MAG: hypothetical protein LVQ97_01965 [Candidatus Micrarchaeales archaeon]|jgi:hypothetical protein|nr:hypothetical protein [Candidatus Micrarchaeales archaeon]